MLAEAPLGSCLQHPILEAFTVLLAAGLGWLLSEMLIAMLQHVFGPQPDNLAVPWRYLVELVGGGAIATVLAAVIAGRTLCRMPLGAVLREQ